MTSPKSPRFVDHRKLASLSLPNFRHSLADGWYNITKLSTDGLHSGYLSFWMMPWWRELPIFSPKAASSYSSREAWSSGVHSAEAGPHHHTPPLCENSLTSLQTMLPFWQQQSRAFSELPLLFNPSSACAGTKARQTARVTFEHKRRLRLQNFPQRSKCYINEVHQAFSIKLLDAKVVSCPRQRRFYSNVSKQVFLLFSWKDSLFCKADLFTQQKHC